MLRPVRLTGKNIELVKKERDGPLGWLLPTLETAYTQLAPRGAAPRSRAATVSLAASSLEPRGGAVLAAAGPTVWRDLLLEYKQRKAAAAAPAAAPRAVRPAAPFVPGARNWVPLGPSVVLDGQTVGEQPVAGRVSGLAIAPGGAVVYAASANGGVFRSADGGTSWRSLMDRFDLDPTSFASASLVCGAVAIDPADPNRVYVGTGEGDTLQLFRSRVTGSLPAYRGVGVIRSDNGGDDWVAEPSSPDLAGEAFFALAVDPGDRENVVGATTVGLYHRVPGSGGGFAWSRVRTGVFSSVAATAPAGGTTRFFAAEWGKGVSHSATGGGWTATGTGFPASDVGRIALGVQAGNPDLVYAFVANTKGAVHGLYRLDGVAGSWRKVGNLPDVLPADEEGRSQGDYDLAIAVDPADANLVYLGGSYANISPFPGSVWRCTVQASGSGFKVSGSASIGTHAHADVHVLLHSPGNPNELWCACDGGVFLNRDPQGTGEFASQNNGLACLCSNFLAQHPTDPNILFSGLQDNGTARTAAGPIWSHISYGDGGYCLVNWADPKLVLVFANGTVHRSTSGGTSHGSWSAQWNFPWATMTQPIVGAPFAPGSPADAGLVAVGAGQDIFVSENFAASWPMSFTIPGGDAAGQVFALAFASRARLLVGTTRGRVFRADRSGNTWSLTRLDDVAAGPIGLVGLITDIAVDWADPALDAVYVCFGGRGDRRRVWRFDGTGWEARSGAAGAGTDLLNVEHNALAVDRATPGNIYVGADIGVWHSADGGLNWAPLQNGLPDAPVFDLQIHPTQRLLRVATHGRGLYELPL